MPIADTLSRAESLSLIDELAGCGVVTLVFAGEPLARPDWRALVNRAVKRGLEVEIETSGAHITAQAAADIAALGVSAVVVGIDSHLAEEHDALRGATGRHDLAVAAVRLLANSGAPVVVGFTATRRNWWDAAEVTALARALRAGAVRFMEYVAGAGGSADLVLHGDELNAARVTWRELARQYRGYIHVSSPQASPAAQPDRPDHDDNSARSARSAVLTPRIRPDGTLTPTVSSATTIGTFRRRSLRDMWTRSPLVAWLQDKLRSAAATTIAPTAPTAPTAPAGSAMPRRRYMVE